MQTPISAVDDPSRAVRAGGRRIRPLWWHPSRFRPVTRSEMHIIDSHFHWWPRRFFEQLERRTTYPQVRRNRDGGYDYRRKEGATGLLNLEPEWFDLDRQFAHMDNLGHRVDVVCSIGPLSIHFSDLPAEEGRDAAM